MDDETPRRRRTIELLPVEPLVVDALSAAKLLLLIPADSDDLKAAERRLGRLIDARRLKPILLGGKRRYALEELRKFVERETEAYPD